MIHKTWESGWDALVIWWCHRNHQALVPFLYESHLLQLVKVLVASQVLTAHAFEIGQLIKARHLEDRIFALWTPNYFLFKYFLFVICYFLQRCLQIILSKLVQVVGLVLIRWLRWSTVRIFSGLHNLLLLCIWLQRLLEFWNVLSSVWCLMVSFRLMIYALVVPWILSHHVELLRVWLEPLSFQHRYVIFLLFNPLQLLLIHLLQLLRMCVKILQLALEDLNGAFKVKILRLQVWDVASDVRHLFLEQE